MGLTITTFYLNKEIFTITMFYRNEEILHRADLQHHLC